MGKTVSKLHAKFYRASLIIMIYNQAIRIETLSIRIHKLKNQPKKNIGVSRKTVLRNIVRKLHVYAEFHQASLIRKCFIIGQTESFTKKLKILFLEQF